MAERIDIPDHCFEPKPLFAEPPGREIIDEIREWVKTNDTYMWRGHTHSKPTPEEAGQIRYVSDFVLPKGVESPCPCCTQFFPKFGKGYIAWFPLTNSIRLMGQDCFRTLNPEGHDFAVRELEERIKREADQAFLLSNLGTLPAILSAVGSAMPIAEYLDSLREILGPRLRERTDVNLWSHVRSGALNVITETDKGPVPTYYANVAGIGLIDPARRSFVRTLEMATRALVQIDLPFDPLTASDQDRGAVVKLFTRGKRLASEALEAMAQARLFVSVLNTATLRTWAALENAPVRLFVRRDDLRLTIGRTEAEAVTIPLNRVIDASIPRLPD